MGSRAGRVNKASAALAVLLAAATLVLAVAVSPWWLWVLPLVAVLAYGAWLGLTPSQVSDAVDNPDLGSGPAGGHL